MFLDGSLLLLGRSEGPALPVTVRVTSLSVTKRGRQALDCQGDFAKFHIARRSPLLEPSFIKNLWRHCETGIYTRPSPVPLTALNITHTSYVVINRTPAILLHLHLAEDILDLAPQNWEDDPDGDGDEGSEAQEGDGHLSGEDEDSADNEAENTLTRFRSCRMELSSLISSVQSTKWRSSQIAINACNISEN